MAFQECPFSLQYDVNDLEKRSKREGASMSDFLEFISVSMVILHWGPCHPVGSKVLQDTLVPLMASRGVEMILGILGIMRTGSGSLDKKNHGTFNIR